jgi:hypothetical protein
MEVSSSNLDAQKLWSLKEFAQSAVQPAQVPEAAFNQCSTILMDGKNIKVLTNLTAHSLSRSCPLRLDRLVRPHRRQSEACRYLVSRDAIHGQLQTP